MGVLCLVSQVWVGLSLSTPEGFDYMECWGCLSECKNLRTYMSSLLLWVRGLNPRVSECTRETRPSAASGMAYVMPAQGGFYITSQRVPLSWVWCG